MAKTANKSGKTAKSGRPVKIGKSGKPAKSGKIDIKKMLPLLVVVFIAVIAYALYSMDMLPFLSGGDDQATTATTRTAAQTAAAKAAAKGATASTSSTEAAQSPEKQAATYAADLKAWQTEHWADIDGGAFSFKRPNAPTSKEIARAKAAAGQQEASVEALAQIVVPEGAAETHARYVAVIEAEAKVVQRLMTAIGNKNYRDIELAVRDLTAAHDLEAEAAAGIAEYLAQFDSAEDSLTQK